MGLLSIITLPTSPVPFVSSVLAYSGTLFTDLSLVVILAIGLPVAFWVIKKVIGLVRAR